MTRLTLKALASIGMVMAAVPSLAQIVIDNTLTPVQLVEDVLLGEGVTASNITFSGNAGQIGYFDATNGSFLLQEGIVMASGNVMDVPGPATTFASTGFGSASDPDLAAIANTTTGSIRDAAILEFDFVPTGDSLVFNYVFASEEYPNFCCGQFNDVFAFLISGPGFNGPYTNNAVNIALLPDGVTPVSISNVNNGTNNTGPCTNCAYYVNNSNGGANGVVYNAHTVVLTAYAQVTCGETYHIKLAIADVADNVYDSGVFLEARSFNSNAIQIDIATLSADSSIVVGCTDATVTFSRPPADTLLALPIHLSGNAINGIHYTGIPDTLTFSPISNNVSFTVTPLDGPSTNPVDTIIITVYTLNLCGDSVETIGVIYIKRDYELDIQLQSQFVACGGIYGYYQVTTTVSGGNPPYSYSWSNGETTPNVSLAPGMNATFSLQVTDSCMTGVQTVQIDIPATLAAPPPALIVSPDVLLACPGQTASLTALASNGIPPYSYTWSTGQTGSTINVQPGQTTDIVVGVTDGCYAGVVRDTVRVTVVPYEQPVLSVGNLAVICPGTDITVNLSTEGGRPPFSYAWGNGMSGASNPITANEDQTISINATDSCGTPYSGSVNIIVPVYADLVAAINETLVSLDDTIKICELWKDTLVAFISGGLSPYNLSWTGSLVNPAHAFNDSVFLNVTYELPGDSTVIETYTLTVTDQCQEQALVQIVVQVINCDILQPSIFNPNSTFAGGFEHCGQYPQNNVFALPCLNLYPGNVVKIYDRWGRKTYEAQNYHDNPWDGGNSATGVYFYLVEVPNRTDILQGYFHLVR